MTPPACPPRRRSLSTRCKPSSTRQEPRAGRKARCCRRRVVVGRLRLSAASRPCARRSLARHAAPLSRRGSRHPLSQRHRRRPVVLHDGSTPNGCAMRSRERITLVSLVPAMLPPLFDAAEAPFPRRSGSRCLAAAAPPRPCPTGARPRAAGRAYLWADRSRVPGDDATARRARAHLGTSGQPLPTTDIRIEREGRLLPRTRPAKSRSGARPCFAAISTNLGSSTTTVGSIPATGSIDAAGIFASSTAVTT